MKILVTGGTGFIGACLIPRLVEAGHEVRAMVYGDPGPLAALPVERVPGDVLDADSVRAAVRGQAVVIHLAAALSLHPKDAPLMRAVNIDGVRNVAEAALEAGVQRMVHLSSVHAYDTWRLNGPLTEDGAKAIGARHPHYDQSKAAGEVALRAVIARGLDATILNPVGVIGPHDHLPSDTGVGMQGLYRGQAPVLPRGGFPFVDVRDVCGAIIAAIERGGVGENHLLSGEFLDSRTMGDVVCALSGRRPPRLVPIGLVRLFLPLRGVISRVADVGAVFTADALYALDTRLEVDASKARAVLGFTARPLRRSIEDAIEWWRATGQLS